MFILDHFLAQKFYSQPDDTPASGAGQDTPAADEGKDGKVIEIKYKGETRKLNLDDPEDLKMVSDYASKGHAYEKGQQQLNMLRSQVDGWNTLIANAKEDDESFQRLVGFIESQTGRSLTAKEKEKLKDIEDELDSEDPVVSKLINRMNTLENRLETDKKASEKAQIDDQANKLLKQLERMEKDQETYPGFNAEEILREAQRRGIYDFEMIYFYTNKDKIIKAEKEKALKEAKVLQEKRRGAFSESSPTPAGAGLKDAPIKAKNMQKLGDAIFEKMKKEGKSFFFK